jgi:hypothetical protein
MAVDRAPAEAREPALRALPGQVDLLLRRLDAPPGLAARLRAVHDVAHRLIDLLRRRYPGVRVDREAVVYGAATHDIGRFIQAGELPGAGSAHARIGHLDQAEGPVADGTDVTFEDLLVRLADTICRTERVPELEQLVVEHLAAASRQEPWEAFVVLDDILGELAEGGRPRQAGTPEGQWSRSVTRRASVSSSRAGRSAGLIDHS